MVRSTRNPTASAKPPAAPATRARTPAASKPLIYHVLPHEGDVSQRWDLQTGARKHEYFRAQRRRLTRPAGLLSATQPTLSCMRATGTPTASTTSPKERLPGA